LLFSQIPNEYLSPDQLHRYFNARIDSDHLSRQLSHLQDRCREKKIPAAITWIIIGFLIIPSLWLSYKLIEFSVKPKLNTKNLKIGTLWKPENSIELEKYLEKELISNNFIEFLK
jgi:hypothetical protein